MYSCNFCFFGYDHGKTLVDLTSMRNGFNGYAFGSGSCFCFVILCTKKKRLQGSEDFTFLYYYKKVCTLVIFTQVHMWNRGEWRFDTQWIDLFEGFNNLEDIIEFGGKDGQDMRPFEIT